MIVREPEETVVHFFAGSGGCTEGFRRAGFRSLGSFDFDAKACRDLARETGGPAFCVDLALVTQADMLRMVARCPGCVVMSPPCKAFSPCLPAEQALGEDYQEMAKLALAGVVLACTTWDSLPGVIMIENVPRITSTGSEVLGQVVAILHRYGYTIDQSTHDCGEIGGLAQIRPRFLLVARQPEVAVDYLRRPPKQRVKAVSEVLGQLPSPVSDHGDEMHRQPLAAAMTWLRLAAVDPMRVVSPRSKGDWRDIPPRIRIGGDRPIAVDPTIVRMRKPAATGSRKAKGAPDDLGVGLWGKPHTTIRGRMDVQSSRASVGDPRVADTKVNRRKSRKNGGLGVEAWNQPGHTVLGEGSVQNTRASIADPRLRCKPRKGAFGVQDGAQPAGCIVGHHAHDNSVGSYADPKVGLLAGWKADPRRGTFGVVDPAGPSPTVRGRHDPRTAPAAVMDERGWPMPTHELVVEDGELVLYGPPVDLDSPKPCLLVIRAPDGTWHRPMTDRELACLQGFPVTWHLEGPSSSTPRRKATATTPARAAVAGRREHIGNAIPPPTAEAIGKMILECLRSRKVATFLRGGDVWVDSPRASMEAAA